MWHTYIYTLTDGVEWIADGQFAWPQNALDAAMRKALMRLKDNQGVIVAIEIFEKEY